MAQRSFDLIESRTDLDTAAVAGAMVVRNQKRVSSGIQRVCQCRAPGKVYLLRDVSDRYAKVGNVGSAEQLQRKTARNFAAKGCLYDLIIHRLGIAGIAILHEAIDYSERIPLTDGEVITGAKDRIIGADTSAFYEAQDAE